MWWFGNSGFFLFFLVLASMLYTCFFMCNIRMCSVCGLKNCTYIQVAHKLSYTTYICCFTIINPRRACARVTVVVLCVCVSVPALAASAHFYTCNQR